VLDQSLYVIIEAKNDEKRLKYLLGILLSNVGAWYLRTKYAIYDTLYPWYTRKQLASFPIKGESQRLVLLVDKMLALAPKLRAAKSDAERKTLQNAVTATDQQIDALVYELYGLTEDEIKLVEGTP
jgi:Xaa-Pro aminopeptidase